jgi:alpha-D-xyloside xylohydrolase
VEDQYLFSTDILATPLLEEARSRDVYLPPGLWTDYQSGETYEGPRWHHLRAGEVPVVALARDGMAIPHVGLAQSTDRIDWSRVELQGLRCGVLGRRAVLPPGGGGLLSLRLEREGRGFALREDPLGGRVDWRVRAVP